MGTAMNNYKHSGQERLIIVQSTFWKGSDKYKDQEYDSLNAVDQMAVDEQYQNFLKDFADNGPKYESLTRDTAASSLISELLHPSTVETAEDTKAESGPAPTSDATSSTSPIDDSEKEPRVPQEGSTFPTGDNPVEATSPVSSEAVSGTESNVQPVVPENASTNTQSPPVGATSDSPVPSGIITDKEGALGDDPSPAAAIGE